MNVGTGLRRTVLFAALAAAGLLWGCAAIQQRQAIATAKEQCAAIFAAPDLAPIRSKVALTGPLSETFEMRTDTAYPSEAEKTTIKRWADARQRCWGAWEPALALTNPQIASAVRDGRQAGDELVSQLYLGRLTYGEFANDRAKVAAEMNDAVAEIDRELRQAAMARAAAVSAAAIAAGSNSAPPPAMMFHPCFASGGPIMVCQ
jgi:hypothetical protein